MQRGQEGEGKGGGSARLRAQEVKQKPERKFALGVFTFMEIARTPPLPFPRLPLSLSAGIMRISYESSSAARIDEQLPPSPPPSQESSLSHKPELL